MMWHVAANVGIFQPLGRDAFHACLPRLKSSDRRAFQLISFFTYLLRPKRLEGAERISRGLITLRGSTLGEEAWDVSLKAAGHVHAACLGASKASRRAAGRRANQVLLSIVHRHRRGVAATTKRANFRSGHGHLLVLDGRRPHQQEVLLGGLSSFGL